MIKQIRVKNITELHSTNMNGEKEVAINAIVDNDLNIEQAEELMKARRVTIFYEVKDNEDILDMEERAYLRSVIAPFRDKVESIRKEEIGDQEYISITIAEEGDLDFPNFDAGTMYKGMEAYEDYTLEDLGI